MPGLRLNREDSEKLDAMISAKTRLLRPHFFVTRQVADAVKAGLARLKDLKKEGTKQ